MDSYEKFSIKDRGLEYANEVYEKAIDLYYGNEEKEIGKDQKLAISMLEECVSAGLGVAGLQLGRIYIRHEEEDTRLRGLDLLNQAYEEGFLYANLFLAFANYEGLIVLRNSAKAYNYLCEIKTEEPFAEKMLTIMDLIRTANTYEDEELELPNAVEEVAELEDLAFAGNAEAQLKLGMYYADAEDSEAVMWLNKAASQGNAKAMYELAHLYYMGDLVEEDITMYRRLLVQAAYAGLPEALYKIGKELYYEKEYDKAKAFLSISAQKRNRDAAFLLGEIAAKKSVGDLSFIESVLYYELSGAHGNELAYYELAKIYASESKDISHRRRVYRYIDCARKINTWHSKEREIFEILGCEEEAFECATKRYDENPADYENSLILATYHLKGYGTSVNKEFAHKIFVITKENALCDTSFVGSHRTLACLYEHGWGVQQDIEKARKHYYELAKYGDKAAIDKYMELEKTRRYMNRFETLKREENLPGIRSLYGVKFSFDEDTKDYIFVRRKVTYLLLSYAAAFESGYKAKIQNAENYIKKIPKMLKASLEGIASRCNSMLESYGIQIGKEEVAKRYLEEIVNTTWGQHYNKVVMQAAKITCNTAHVQALSKTFASNPGSWMTFSDGSVRGDMKAAATTMLFNFVTSVGANLVNSIVNGASSSSAQRNIDALLNDPQTIEAYPQEILGLADHLTRKIMEELRNHHKIRAAFCPEDEAKLLFKKSLEKQTDRSKGYLVSAIAKDPFNRNYYEEAKKRFGDDNGTLTELANAFMIE